MAGIVQGTGVITFIKEPNFGYIRLTVAGGAAPIDVNFRYETLVAGYVPNKGDNVSVDYVPQPNGKNFAKSVRPLAGGAAPVAPIVSAVAHCTEQGVITHINPTHKFGYIRVTVAGGAPIDVNFRYDALAAGYVPTKGDDVSVEFVPQSNGKNFAKSVKKLDLLQGAQGVPTPVAVAVAHQTDEGVITHINPTSQFGYIRVTVAGAAAPIDVNFRYGALVAGYIPNKGDNVSVDYVPQPNGKNFAKSVRPLAGGVAPVAPVVPAVAHCTEKGVITHINPTNKFGYIRVTAASSAVVDVNFRYDALAAGYIPTKGDNVSVDYVPQSNGKNFAKSVRPLAGVVAPVAPVVPPSGASKIRETFILWDIENMPMNPATANASLRKLDGLLQKDKLAGRGISKVARFFFTSKTQYLVPPTLMKKLDEAGYKPALVASVKPEAVDKEIAQQMNQIGRRLTHATAGHTAVVLISGDHDFYSEMRRLHELGVHIRLVRSPMKPHENPLPTLFDGITWWWSPGPGPKPPHLNRE